MIEGIDYARKSMWTSTLLLLTAVTAAPFEQDDTKAPSKVLVQASKETLIYKGGEFTAQEEVKAEDPSATYRVSRVEFTSPIATEYTKNNKVVSFLYTPAQRQPDAAVLILPGWCTGLTPEKVMAISLAKRGILAMILLLPYQRERSPEGIPSDRFTLSSDLDRTEAVMVQAVLDAQRAAAWLRREKMIPKGKLGIFGLSLGGYAASVAYSVTDDFSAAVLALCGGNITEMLWSDTWLGAQFKKDFLDNGFTLEKLRDRLKRIDPVTYANPSKSTGVMIIASSDDEIVKKANVESLAKEYGDPTIIWLKGSHVAAIKAISPTNVGTFYEKALLGK